MNAITPARRRAPRALAFAAALALLSSSIPFAGAQTPVAKGAPRKMSEEQRVVHVLNRLGFGARPGDVERVRRMGVEAYIEQQLNPSKIDDARLEARLRDFPTLTLTNGELLAKYPQPGRLLRRLQREGELPPELADLVGQQRQRQPGRPVGASGPTAAEPDAEKAVAEALRPPAGAMQGEGQPIGEADPQQEAMDPRRRAYRRALARYMRERGLESPQRIMFELNASRLLRAVYSERQLQEVMVDFWTNHFNVYAQKGADRWYLTSYDRDVIRPNALGNFRDLLEATARSPAMLFYLDNFQSVSPNAQANRRRPGRDRGQDDAEDPGRMRRGGRRMRDGEPWRRPLGREMMAEEQPQQGRAEGEAASTGQQPRPRQPRRMRRGINENYARELMELHTLGVEGGYTQKDVQEVARAFTGWTIYAPRGEGAYGDEGDASRAGTFFFNQRTHDPGEKTVLGVRIPAGGGVEDGRKVLDVLVAHPSTAKFIATKLCRKFVSDSPDPALVRRVAEAFQRSNGDIRTTLRAIFGSAEFNSADARRAKIKSPFELAASALRTLDARVEVRPALVQWVARMGEPLYGYQAPTGYPDTAEYWVNTGALLERLNFSLALVSNRIPGARVDLSRFVGDEAVSSRAVDQKAVVERFLALALQGDISSRSREVLLKQLTAQADAPIVSGPDEEAREKNVRAARRERQSTGATVGNPEVARIAALVIGSPEFQRQ